MYNIDELVAFDTVMTLGSLTRSAHQLGLAKSTLSRRIAHLEQQLGQTLLRRQSNRLLPTEAGQVFHRYCARILELTEQSRDALDELQTEIRGEVQLTLHSELGPAWLIPRLGQFLQRHPAVRLTLQTCNTPPVDADSQGVSVWLGNACTSEQRQEVLGWLSCGIYGNPAYFAEHGHPQHPDELTRHPWIERSEDDASGTRLAHARQGSRCFPLADTRLRCDHSALHGDSIASGHGLGLMPNWLAAMRERTRPGSLVRCLTEWHAPPMPVTLLYPYGSQPRRLSALIAFLRQAVPAEWAAPPEMKPKDEAGTATTAVAFCATQRCVSAP